MAKNLFRHKVHLIPLRLENSERNQFCAKLMDIPYLLYEVEKLSTGEKILVNKPGGKRNFGRLARNDFMVFIFNPQNEELWLISHKEIFEDLKQKYQVNPLETEKVIYGLLDVCNGKEPEIVMTERNFSCICGLAAETLLKVYKWIWGQEDCNYQSEKADGRWKSMNAILEEFNIQKC